MAQKYAKGTRAWGICGRGGHRVLLKDMVFDGRYPNMRVDPAWYEDKHPQEFLPKVEDPIALYRPAVEVITGPTAPVLAVILTGTQASLTWSPSETDITEIDSYTIMRSIDGAPAVVLIVCAVLRDFLGGIIGVQHCTTVPSIPSDDSGDSGSVYDKVTNEDAPITYVDTTLSSGHTYCYTVFSTPMGNNQSVAQGPPSANSNTVCVTTAGGGGGWIKVDGGAAPALGLQSIAILDATHVVTMDAFGAGLISSDAGATWTPVTVTAGDVASSLITNASGSVVLMIDNGNLLLWRSTDHGATWASQGPISPIHPIVFYFAAADRFFYFDTLGNVQYSTDGLTWSQQALPAGFLPAEGFQPQNQCGQAQPGAHIALAGQDTTTGSFGQVLVSTDAIHWTVGTTDTTNDNPYVCIVALGANYVASAIGNAPNPQVVDLFSVPIAQAAIPADWALISSAASNNVPPFNQQLVILGSLLLNGFDSTGTFSARSSNAGVAWSLANPMVDSQSFLYADAARAYAFGTNLYETTDGLNWTIGFFAGAGGIDGPLAVLSAHGLTMAVGSTGSIWKRT